jgi:polyphenol oxidase
MFTNIRDGWQAKLLPIDNRYYLTVNHPRNKVNIAFTTRTGGFSSDQYKSFNLASHVEDRDEVVDCNRKLVETDLEIEPLEFLNQTHSTNIKFDQNSGSEADGIVTEKINFAAAVLTADCVPIVICDRNFNKVGAIHAGWRGLLNGIVESGFECFSQQSYYVIGPHISQPVFEVGSEVYQMFCDKYEHSNVYFERKGERYLFNMKGLIAEIARKKSMIPIADIDACTFNSSDLFFSYRRNGSCGRQASLIWRS